MWSCVFFSLLNPYACPSHLSNYLLTWNTLLAVDFFSFISLCIYHVCLRQYHQLVCIVVRPVFLSAKIPSPMSKKFLRETNSIQIAGFHNSDTFVRFEGNFLVFLKSRVSSFLRDNAAFSGRILIGAGGRDTNSVTRYIYDIYQTNIYEIFIYIFNIYVLFWYIYEIYIYLV